MTTSDPRKMLKQLNKKPHKLTRFKKYNLSKKRSCGRATASCTRCGRTGIGGFVGQYKLKYCRCCFREIAPKIGFKKYSWGKNEFKWSISKCLITYYDWR